MTIRETDADEAERVLGGLHVTTPEQPLHLDARAAGIVRAALRKSEFALDQLCAAAGKLPRHTRPDTRDALRAVRDAKRHLNPDLSGSAATRASGQAPAGGGPAAPAAAQSLISPGDPLPGDEPQIVETWL